MKKEKTGHGAPQGVSGTAKRRGKGFINLALALFSAAGVLASLLSAPEEAAGPFQLAARAASSPYMKITCIDLGGGTAYGEAVLLESRGQYLLMDTGSRDSQNTVMRYLKSNGIRNLSLYLSHYHGDHCYYATSILKDSWFHVRRLYLANPDPVRKYITPWHKSHRRKIFDSCRACLDRYNQIASAANKKGVPVTALRRGKSFSIGDVRAAVLWDHNSRGAGSFDPYDVTGRGFQNNNSLVTKFTLGRRSFLTCGDIEGSTERDLLVSGVNLSADILKLNHHAIWTSNLAAFVKSVNPCYCFYSYKDTKNADAEFRRFASAADTSSCLKRLAKNYNILGNRYNGTITYKVQHNTIYVSAQRRTKARWIRVQNLSDGKIRTQKLVYNDAQPLFLDKRMLFSGTKMASGTAEDRTPGYSGWHRDSKGWRYRTTKGKWLAGGWKRIGKSDYYFNAKGYRREGWLGLKGKKYFMNRLGVRQTGWQMIDGKIYYFSVKTGAMMTGKTWIGGTVWPLRSDGSLDLSKKKAPGVGILTAEHRHTTK